MCTALLPPGGYRIAVNKYIVSYHIICHIVSSYRIVSYIVSYHLLETLVVMGTDFNLHTNGFLASSVNGQGKSHPLRCAALYLASKTKQCDTFQRLHGVEQSAAPGDNSLR